MPAAILERYLLYHELAATTQQTYRRCVSTWRSWAGAHGDPAFSEEAVSQFLRDKQAQGCSSYYRKSCRSALVALLHSAGMAGQVRGVRLEPLDVECWSPEEVARLVSAVPGMFRWLEHQQFWATLIQAGWYSGLNWIDLRAVRKEDVPADGWLRWRRHKTRKPVTVYLPHRLVEHVAGDLVWRWPYCEEVFRQQFARIVKRAGLTGSFKTLRKSAATAVEEACPGRGHVYIGDERRTFEKHYWRVEGAKEIHPPDLPAALRIA